MVKWSVLQQTSIEGSLPIQFFKVQYILIPQEVPQRKSDDWITLSEDIPPHLRSYEIHNLKPDNHYKFRISAVYSNNDNKQSPIRRFHLKRIKQSGKSNLPIPTDIHIEPASETEVKVKWSIPEAMPHHYSFGGFYISYRPAISADDYLVVSCEGPHKRHHNIKFLEPGTVYEFKIQSFSAMAASEFSSIVTGRTLSEFFFSRHNDTLIAASNYFRILLSRRNHAASIYHAADRQDRQERPQEPELVPAPHRGHHWRMRSVVPHLSARLHCLEEAPRYGQQSARRYSDHFIAD
jgi:hypothetical protein